jgi:hypothetical protein
LQTANAKAAVATIIYQPPDVASAAKFSSPPVGNAPVGHRNHQISKARQCKRLGSASSKPVTCRLAVVRRVGMIPIDVNHEAANVIDNQDQAVRLLRKLTEVLPLSALATPALLAHLRGRSSAAKITLNCVVTKVFYLGDEGGITCHVTFDEEEK